MDQARNPLAVIRGPWSAIRDQYLTFRHLFPVARHLILGRVRPSTWPVYKPMPAESPQSVTILPSQRQHILSHFQHFEIKTLRIWNIFWKAHTHTHNHHHHTYNGQWTVRGIQRILQPPLSQFSILFEKSLKQPGGWWVSHHGEFLRVAAVKITKKKEEKIKWKTEGKKRTKKEKRRKKLRRRRID